MEKEKKDKKYIPLDEAEINLFKAYGLGPYADSIKKLEEENKEMVEKINKLTGIFFPIQVSRNSTLVSLYLLNGIWPGTLNWQVSNLCKWLGATKLLATAKKTNMLFTSNKLPNL